MDGGRSRGPASGLRTSVRLSLQFSFLYAVLSALVFAMAYWFTQYEVRDWVQERMQGDAQVLAQIYDQRGLDAVIDRIDALTEVSYENSRLFQLLDDSGAILSGNITQPMGRPLPVKIAANHLPLSMPANPEISHFWMEDSRVGPYRLIQGTGDHIITEVLEALGAALVLGYLAVIILGLIFGVRVGRLTEARITAIVSTLPQVSAGQLATRVPLGQHRGDDLARVSQQINIMLDQITGLLESQRQISTDIAHDMRTPLQRLYQRLERMSLAQKICPDDLIACQEQTQNIIATFNALLRIAQLEAGQQKLRFEVTDLGLILADIVDLFGPVAEDKGIILQSDLPQTPLLVTGDRGLLTQLFTNLLENAIKHCPSGTHVQITAQEQDKQIIACVKDDGPGIALEDHARIFRRFFRAEQSRNSPGNGLGLALVKAIADIHEASVTVSDQSPGTVFEIRLPRAGQSSAQPSQSRGYA